MAIKFENNLGQGWKAYVKPFDDALWYSIFGYLVVSMATFMLIGYFNNQTFYINPLAGFYSFCSQGWNPKIIFQNLFAILNVLIF